MKRFFKYICAITLLLTACGSGADTKQWKMVSAKSGLKLRSAAAQSASPVATLPFLSRVQIVEKNSKVVKVGKIKGSWWKVRWNGKSGWAYSAFLKKPELALAGTAFLLKNNSVSESGDTTYRKTVRILYNGLIRLETVYDSIPAVVENVTETLTGKYRVSGNEIIASFNARGTRVTRKNLDDGGKSTTGGNRQVQLQYTFILSAAPQPILINSAPIPAFGPGVIRHAPSAYPIKKGSSWTLKK